jgi:hypothetical protein
MVNNTDQKHTGVTQASFETIIMKPFSGNSRCFPQERHEFCSVIYWEYLHPFSLQKRAQPFLALIPDQILELLHGV